MPPLLTPKGGAKTSPKASHNPRTPSPNYFGYIVDSSNPPDSNPGAHTKKNWDFPQSQGVDATPTPKTVPVEGDPEFTAFRRQSEHNSFKLSHGGLSTFKRQHSSDSPIPRAYESPQPLSPQSRSSNVKSPARANDVGGGDLRIPRRDSPGLMPSAHQLSSDEHHARLSLPTNVIEKDKAQSTLRQVPRAETLPSSTVGPWAPSMITAEECRQVLQSAPNQALVLDLRAYPQYSESRIQNSLNLCIPTTLLKRPSYDISKLAQTFASAGEKEKFSRWREYSSIIVYDQNSMHMREAIAPINLLKKFSHDNWPGKAWIIKGGFQECAKRCPDMINHQSTTTESTSSRQTLSMAPVAPGIAPVAGGCPMPTSKNAANPFFGNIRQNMDLIGGVGQIPIQLPDQLKTSPPVMPQWLQHAADPQNQGRDVSEKFLKIEKTEQRRMQSALSSEVTYSHDRASQEKDVQIAGIEKGSKNRYNNIFPYDHARVRLKDVPSSECDYVNASHVKTAFSNKHYIATQAPIPTTLNDFWRLVWEQDSRVIVMLSAESEGGQIKAHPYWHTGDYGPLKLKLLSEKRVPLDPDSKPLPINPALKRPSLGQRRSTNPHTAAEKNIAEESSASTPSSDQLFVIVRRFTLSHSAFPFQPMREITQLQYNNWPDFGAPASPTHLLNLIEHVSRSVFGTMSPTPMADPESPFPLDSRPLVVHCSAGCGRTGTFCTVDSVIDMLRHQKAERRNRRSRSPDAMDIDDENSDWLWRDDEDLIAKAVEDLRFQRLSMVQSLRQFVLCYESVAEWVVRDMAGEKGKAGLSRDVLKGGARLSYHG
ncbi:MAG: hypothetical protein Q9160_008601 [Pyrenula sp. 1 TL-2023]